LFFLIDDLKIDPMNFSLIDSSISQFLNLIKLVNLLDKECLNGRVLEKVKFLDVGFHLYVCEDLLCKTYFLRSHVVLEHNLNSSNHEVLLSNCIDDGQSVNRGEYARTSEEIILGRVMHFKVFFMKCTVDCFHRESLGQEHVSNFK
jgi:hypothetical protein